MSVVSRVLRGVGMAGWDCGDGGLARDEVRAPGEGVEVVPPEARCPVVGPTDLVGYTWEQLEERGRIAALEAEDCGTREGAAYLEGCAVDGESYDVSVQSGPWYRFLPRGNGFGVQRMIGSLHKETGPGLNEGNGPDTDTHT